VHGQVPTDIYDMVASRHGRGGCHGLSASWRIDCAVRAANALRLLTGVHEIELTVANEGGVGGFFDPAAPV